MKSTDIPNGCVMRGRKGHNNLLIDIDESGKLSEDCVDISISGWPVEMFKDGVLLDNMIVLVHSVKGESGMLVRRLHACMLSRDNKDLSVRDLSGLGLLKDIVEKVWKDYMVDVINDKSKVTEVICKKEGN